MESNVHSSKPGAAYSTTACSNPDGFFISCFKSINRRFYHSLNARVPTNPVLREATKNFSWNKNAFKNEQRNQKPLEARKLSRTVDSRAAHYPRPRNTELETLNNRAGLKELKSRSTPGWLHNELEGTKSDCRNRIPREAIKTLLNNSIQMSVLSSRVCEESHRCPEPVSSSNLEALYLVILKHHIEAMDITLSAELPDTCQILLQGFLGISKALRRLTRTGTNRSAPQRTSRRNYLILQLTEALELQTTKKMNESGMELKQQFLKLQLHALVATTAEPGSYIFSTALRAIIKLADRLLQDVRTSPLSTLRWEDGNHPTRRIYWLVMQEIYSEAEACQEGKKSSKSAVKNNSAVPACNANGGPYQGENPKNTFNKFSTENEPNKDTTQESSRKCKGAAHDINRNSKSKLDFDSGRYSHKKTNPGNRQDGQRRLFQRRYRRPDDLVIDMNNHVLHLNNCKYTLINKLISADPDFPTQPFKSDQYLLLDVLRHQIAVLDLVLTSELYDTAAILIYGIWDTAASIMSGLSSNCNENSPTLTHGDGDGEDGELQLGGEFIQSILLAIELYQKTIIRTKKATTLKYGLIKIQLDALVLTHCSTDHALFRRHLEQLHDECKAISEELRQNWWTKYFSLNWETALPEEEELCCAYWTIIAASFPECGMH